jgi:hypothetical protein
MTIHFKIDNTINTLIVKKQLNCSLSSVHSASQDRPACLRAPTHASCLVPHAALASPRAAYALCLALHSTAPHASRPNSRCAQRRSDLRAVASSSVLAPSSASMSVQLGVASRWAYVVTVCFMRFRCMLHMFYLDVAKLDLVLHMLQWLCTYVAKCMFLLFQPFQTYVQVFYQDVVCIALAIHV